MKNFLRIQVKFSHTSSMKFTCLNTYSKIHSGLKSSNIIIPFVVQQISFFNDQVVLYEEMKS